MIKYPTTFDELMDNFPTEEACIGYLCNLRWGKGFNCPKCDYPDYWETNKTLRTCKRCRHQTTVFAGTMFHGTRKPLRDWFKAVWWVASQKYASSALGLQQELGLKSYQTAWTWLQKIRIAMAEPTGSMLSGFIEVDVVEINRRKKGETSKQLFENSAVIIVAAEVKHREIHCIRISKAVDTSSSSITKFVSDNVQRGSKILSHVRTGDAELRKIGFKNIAHVQPGLIRTAGDVSHVGLVITLLENWLLKSHHGDNYPKHLQAYLNEFVFKFNRRSISKRGLLFQGIMENAMLATPTTYNQIIKDPATLK